MAVSIVVARIVGPSVLGTVAFGMAFVSMFQFITDLGTGTAHIKLISEGKDEASCIGTFMRIKIVLIGIFFFVVIAVFLTQILLIKHPFESVTDEYVIVISLFTVVFEQSFFIAITTFMAKTEQAKQNVPEIIKSIFYQVLRVAAVLLGLKAIGLSATNLISTLLLVPVYIYLFRNYKIGQYDKELAKQYWRISLPLIVIVIAQTLVYWTDKVILQYLTNSKQVGYYSAAFNFGYFITMIGSSVGTLLFPTFSTYLVENNFLKINSIINKLERFILIFLLPIVVCAAIRSDIIVKILLGRTYIPSIPIFSVILISYFVMVLSQPYANLLFGKGLFKLNAKLYVLQVIFFVGMSFLMVAPFLLNLKGVGMAGSILGANLFLSALWLAAVKKKIPEIRILHSRKLLVFSVAYSMLFFLISITLECSIFIKLLLALLYIAGYAGFLIFFKLLRTEDLAMVKELLNISKIKHYISSEIKSR